MNDLAFALFALIAGCAFFVAIIIYTLWGLHK